MAERRVAMPKAFLSLSENAKRSGYIMICIAEYPEAIGMIALSDILRSDTAQTIDTIHQTEVRIVLLTGDAAPAASRIAANAGLRDMWTDCLPKNKPEETHAYQKTGEPVCMVGDDVSGASALKAVSIGITMGGVGSDIIIDAIDIVLVSDDIKEIPHLLQFSRKTVHTIKINLAVPMALNLVAITLVIAGVLTPATDALAHNVGSVAVIIHFSLLLKWRKIK